jgi:hypothetical protein
VLTLSEFSINVREAAMPQIFHKSWNSVAKTLVLGLPLLFASTGVGLAVFYRSSYATGVNEILDQPVPFSHLHHVGQLGIDCRYCHTSVEHSATAGIPPTRTCMNCHQQMWVGADMLGPVRDSFKADEPLKWNKVHNVPHYAYFNHSIHISKGVSCVSCHGQVNEMPLMQQTKTLLMEWCLKCHRNPEPNLRPRDKVFNMTWTIEEEKKPDGSHYTQEELGKLLKEKHHIRDAATLTSCSMCHR